ncbi:DUF2971 domain-containing protein [Flavobacterium undicola]|uniref:DUF2971 domain-containing protein n=1 Tax=Flavobacterium undicola TaxID=1932779 RepID=UPI00137707E5|nr:DUF2971 domain-containing protein [Flavobacterium undicola]MBA0885031.1 DUF2971 domain-containing protein [Flavobacterium undicola]
MSFIKEIFIKQFEYFADKADEFISNTSEYKQNTQLYHYTSLESLESMIKSQSIRASSIFLMNDPNELIFGQEKTTDKFIQPLSSKLKQLYERQSINNFSAFVFSLSELNDDMNQWEKYGDKHKGVRIGFTPKNLLEFWYKIDSIDVFLVPVIYHDNNSKYLAPYGTIFNEMKSSFISDINNHYANKEISHSELNELQFFCSVISSMIKRKEWSSEKEWRIICISKGIFHQNINGSFHNGKSKIFIENRTGDTLKMFTNDGHDGVASKDILKIGCKAGNKEQIGYILSLLYEKKVIMQVSQSDIQTR